MKRILLILAIVTATIATSCKKDSKTTINTAPVTTSSINGTWELRSTSGGLVASNTYQPGNGTMYVFAANNSYTYLVSSKVSKSGTYQFKKLGTNTDNSIYGDIFFNGDTNGEAITLDSNILILGSPDADGLASGYAKIIGAQ